MANKTIHVLRDGNVWIVKKGGASRASAIRNTQKEAYLIAREIALNQGLSITVHKPNGQIEKVIRPKDRSSGDGNCFITSACVNYYGLSDDCYQLRMLRGFRDNYLLKSSEGEQLVKDYYRIGPRIVKLLLADRHKDKLFSFILEQVNSACDALEKNQNQMAETIYRDNVIYLIEYFKISL
jgi:hypothetical protein